MTGEQREINRRVAERLGYSRFTCVTERSGYSRFTIDAPAVWYAHRPGEKEMILLPDFVGDPQATELVWADVDRRQWPWHLSMRGRHFVAEINGHEQADQRAKGFAICLAFLAACEATDTD